MLFRSALPFFCAADIDKLLVIVTRDVVNNFVRECHKLQSLSGHPHVVGIEG
jgi:hypothetical protein